MADTPSLFGHKPRARRAEQVAADGPRARAMAGGKVVLDPADRCA